MAQKQRYYSKLNKKDVEGDWRFRGDATIDGDASVAGDFAIGDDATVAGDLAVTGALAVTGTLTVTDEINGSDRFPMVAVVDLVAAAGNGGVLAWANPEAVAIIVDGFAVRIATQSSGACTVDFGKAADGTTSADNLIDGLSIAAAGLFNSIDDKGTNGKSRQLVGVGEYVTGTVASGTVTGLVGKAYIRYIKV